MQNNLFFLCGPHGSGKTTLGKKLSEQNKEIAIPELYSRNIKFNMQDEQYRQYLKICSRAI
jgi:adenylate kinase family enzyme